MTDRELMQMALDTLSMAAEPKKGKVYAFEFQPIDCAAMYLKAIETLRARLAQPEHEWVGMTDEEFKWIVFKNHNPHTQSAKRIRNTIKEIEAKLKEKNT
jgi:hypothetical protein